jgi:hypothetical protein
MLPAVASDIRTVSAPDGRSFTIFVAAPGSALDCGSDTHSGVTAVELLVHAARDAHRVMSGHWRLDVEPLSLQGHLGSPLYRERFADGAAAEKRAAELAAMVESGQWDPTGFGTPPDSAEGAHRVVTGTGGSEEGQDDIGA